MPSPPRRDSSKYRSPAPSTIGLPSIADPELGQPFHEGVLKRSEARHHRDHRVAQRLGPPVGRAHHPRQEVRRLDDLLDHRHAFGAVALEQPIVAAAVQDEIELPDQVPRVMQTGIHPLSTVRTVNVRRVAGDEHPSHAQLRGVPMMDAEVAAPVHRERLDLRRAPADAVSSARVPATARRLRSGRRWRRCGGGSRSSERSRPGRTRSGTAAARWPAAHRSSRRRPA